MVANKCRGDAPNICREIDQHCRKGPELDNRHRRGYLLRMPVVNAEPSRREYKMGRRADRDKLRQTLNNAENDCLYEIHLWTE